MYKAYLLFSCRILSIACVRHGCLPEFHTLCLELLVGKLNYVARKSYIETPCELLELQNKVLRYRKKIFSLLVADKCNFELLAVIKKEVILHMLNVIAISSHTTLPDLYCSFFSYKAL